MRVVMVKSHAIFCYSLGWSRRLLYNFCFNIYLHFTLTFQGCYYRSVIDLDQLPRDQKVHIILGIESARLITGKGKDLVVKTAEKIECPP